MVKFVSISLFHFTSNTGEQANNIVHFVIIFISIIGKLAMRRCGVVGNTADSESVAPGSIPGTA